MTANPGQTRSRYMIGLGFFPGDDVDGRGAFHVQCPGRRVEGQGDLVVAQTRDDVLGAGVVPGVGSSAGSAPALALAAVGSGQEQVQGRQVRQDAARRLLILERKPGPWLPSGPTAPRSKAS